MKITITDTEEGFIVEHEGFFVDSLDEAIELSKQFMQYYKDRLTEKRKAFREHVNNLDIKETKPGTWKFVRKK